MRSTEENAELGVFLPASVYNGQLKTSPYQLPRERETRWAGMRQETVLSQTLASMFLRKKASFSMSNSTQILYLPRLNFEN